tara:strand:+ start:68 stop:496 length:429 start_codon:yes stop_codon:yes gene_type:complete
MSKISNLIAEKIAEIEYPGIEGFKIKLRYLPRDELTKIRSSCLSYKFSKVSHQREEEVNNDKFIKLYSEKAIAGWSGLTVGALPQLLPVKLTGVDLKENIPYDKKEAHDLLKNSVPFDQFVTDSMQDLAIFEDEQRETEEKN